MVRSKDGAQLFGGRTCKQRRHGVADLPIPRVRRAAIMSARQWAFTLVGRENKSVWKRLQPSELAHRQGTRNIVMVDGVALRVQRPRPDVGMKTAVGIEVSARKPSGTVVLSPALASEVTIEQVGWKIAMVSTLGYAL